MLICLSILCWSALAVLYIFVGNCKCNLCYCSL